MTAPGSTTETDAAPGTRARRRLTNGQREAIALAVVSLAFLVPLRGLLRAPGPPMEEGFMLVFPERVLAGDVPNRDFLHLYGPGSLWTLAGLFKVFGVSLLTERLFGLGQQMLVVFGVYALARPWGRILAVACALTSALILVPTGLTALAWIGALGLGLFALVAGLRAHRAGTTPAGARWALLAGMLVGLALLFRPDLILALGIAAIPVLRGLDRRRVERMLIGAALGIAPMLIHVLTAGPGTVVDGMILEPIFDLRGGRGLPIPPGWSRLDGFLQRAGALEMLPWPIPRASVAQQLFLWFLALLAVVVFLLVVARQMRRRDPASFHARSLMVIACFSAGLLPQALQRVDSQHLAWVGCVPFAFVPIATFEVLRRQAPAVPTRRLAIASGAGVLVAIALVIPAFTAQRYTDLSLESISVHRNSHLIERNGRTFYYGKPDRAAAANAVIAEAARLTEPGDRLFVGPKNLRKTPYSDAYLYYMLPELDPATHYIEMDPGVANAEGSGLADDLASADIAILSSIWDDWDEPNDSRDIGSAEAEGVLEEQFCLAGNYLDRYELYRKCV
ncbi:MAG: hypothetical protein ABWZ15_15135 [Acidimicrobiia bacterium]